jgi:hypothetical protein
LTFSGQAKAFIKDLNKKEMDNLIDRPGGMISLGGQLSKDTATFMPELVKSEEK